jgi:anti-anti-sigma factor
LELELQIVTLANVAVVRCHGRLIYGQEAAELDRTLRSLLETTKQIVLQMADLIQIDSGGVGALGAAFMAAHNRGGVIKLADLTPRVGEVLRITGLERLFDVHDSETEAIEAFARSSTASVTTSS